MAERQSVVGRGVHRFVLGCGGTGGHIFPALAIAQQLEKLGHQTVFIGNRGGMEETLVQAEGHTFHGIKVQKLYRKLSLDNLLFPFFLVSSTLACIKLLRQTKPSAVICTGGFVSGPVGIAAALLRIPLYFHESNSYPGITTRYLARFTRFIYTGFSGTARHLPRSNVREIGIPLPQKEQLLPELGMTDIGLEESRPTLLITGGSQGSQAINSAVASALPHLRERGWQFIWQTGQPGYDEYSSRFGDLSGVYIFAFSPQLKSFYKLAGVAVTRAGAMTIAELIENRLPAILIPLPNAAENHQHFNALDLQHKGLALLLKQSELNGETLVQKVTQVWAEHAGFMSRLAKLPQNTAAENIAREILHDLDKEQTHAGKN